MKFLALSVLLLLAGLAPAAGPSSVSFTRDVAPVLVAKCLGCHNAAKAKGGYRLHTFEALGQPGDSRERPVVPGQARASLIHQLLVTARPEDRMPQEDEPLPQRSVALIERWIEQGATFDGTDRTLPLALLNPPPHPAAPVAYAVPVPVTALAFTPDGALLAAGGYHEITLWEAVTGRLQRRLGGVAERVFDLACSADGAWLACAAGTPGQLGEVKLFPMTNGASPRTLVITVDAQLAVAFARDGRRLAAGGADHAIRVWDVPAGTLLHKLETHADWVLALAFSPDGRRLLSGSRDKSARVLDVRTGELETTHHGHGDFVTAVAWADDQFALSGSRERTVQRWNARDGKKGGEFSGWEAAPTRLLIASNRLFSAALDGRVRAHHMETRALSRSLEGARDAAHALAWHAASGRLAAGFHNGEVWVWDADTGQSINRFLAVPGREHALSRP